MSTSDIRVLVADDEAVDRDAATAFLENRGFKVESPKNREEMKRLLTDCEFDLVLLDFEMPGWTLDTKTVVARSNKEIELPVGLPVIMMSGKVEEDEKAGISDRVEYLVAGADDFVDKPEPPLKWGDTQLRARIDVVLRRVNGRYGTDSREGAVYAFEGWSLDPVRRELCDPGGVLVELTDGEFRLLLALLREPGEVLARDKLLGSGDASDRSIDVHVSRLRKKLQRSSHDTPEFIKTVRGGGYIFAVPVQRP